MEPIKTVLNHELIRTNGVTLNVVQAGPEDGPLVILLHGFPEFWYGWRRQIDALADLGLRLWIPDQRGYNLSDKPSELVKYRISEMATDVIGLMDAAGEEKAMIVGHDWGAMVAWWTGILYPERLEKMGILNVPHPKVFAKTLQSDIQQMLKSWYAGFFQVPFLPEAMMRLNDWNIPAQTLRQTSRKGTFTEDEIGDYKRAWSRPDAMTSMLNWYRAYSRHPMQSPANWRISTPTIMIWGTKDFALSQEMAQPSINLCDNGQLHLIETAGHWVQHEEPERVNELLGAFLTQEKMLDS